MKILLCDNEHPLTVGRLLKSLDPDFYEVITREGEYKYDYTDDDLVYEYHDKWSQGAYTPYFVEITLA